VQEKVNEEIERRVRDFQGGKRLKFQSHERWKPNASFCNCYTGPAENVGWHSDHLTYLGPRAIIGSLSLGVTREFRVRKIVPQVDGSSADEQGQIAIHLPHNSLLVMHAEMQEEWKHSIAPAKSIDPHPIAGNRRCVCDPYSHWFRDIWTDISPHSDSMSHTDATRTIYIQTIRHVADATSRPC
jgi:hypothetical protein